MGRSLNSENHLRKVACVLAFTCLTGCGENRAVMLPLQYPDGTPVTTQNGEPLMAGYQTYGSAIHANATAFYASPRPATCATCSQITTVVSEPSVLRQATGVAETATLGAGAVMTGVGIMNSASDDDRFRGQDDHEWHDRDRHGWGHGHEE